MEIVYENTYRDSINFHIYHTFRSTSLLIVTLIGLAFLALKVWPMIDPNFLFSVKVITTIFLLLPFILIMYGGTIILGVIAIFIRKQEGFLTQHKVEINEEGLTEETHINSTTHRWKGIANISHNKKYIFIYVRHVAAHVIPKRAFKSRKEEKGFFQLANQYWHAAKQAEGQKK